MKKKMLLVFAHPDDEAFTCGGTIPKYIQQGWEVDLICATKGEAGNFGPYTETEDLAALRQQELEEAAALLGISSVIFLDHKDGKMKNISPGELEETLYKKFLEIVPDVVITFEPNGISNHPDHIKLSLSTTFAFQKYAEFAVSGKTLGKRDPRRKFVQRLGAFEDKSEPRLYYACMPESVANFLLEHNVLPKESFGKLWRGVPDKSVTTVIDISDYTETKIAALAKHKTQIEDAERFVSIDSQPLVYTEYFILRMQGEQEVFFGKSDTVAHEL